MQIILKAIFLYSLITGNLYAQANQNCTQLGFSPPPLTGANLPCCSGLTLNNAGKCDTTPVNDGALVACTTDSQCSGGASCLPQTTAVMFNSYSPSSTPEDIPKRDEFETQLSGLPAPKDNGESCNHAKYCKSYSCVGSPGVCSEKKVCRFSAEGEVAGANATCGPDLVKASNGTCQKSPESQNGVYAGLMENGGVSSDDQCKMIINTEALEKSKIAMRSLRAMEWLFATINITGESECLGIFPLLRDEIGKTIYSARKNILKTFSTEMNRIEEDFKTLHEASEAYKLSLTSNSLAAPQATLVSFNGASVSKLQLGSQNSSGLPSLMLTYQKNNALKNYEMAMVELLTSVSPKLSALSTAMESWSNDAETWSLGQSVYNNRDCEGSRYEEKEWWDWDSFYYHSLKDRYANVYFVKGDNANNSSIINRENVKNVLTLIGQFSNSQEAVNYFTKPIYVLMDPPMYGGLFHGIYGLLVDSSNYTGFLSWGGFRDHRKEGNLFGDGSRSLKSMHDKLKDTIKDFYKNLKDDPQLSKFIYEPELVDTGARDCFDASRTEKCSEFDAFLEEVVDESFAHFLAFSMREGYSYTFPGYGITFNYHNKYKNYFNNANSLKRKLFAKLEVDMQNLSMYYNSIISERDKQNACIEKLGDNLINSGIFNAGSGGLNYDNGVSTSLNSGPGASAVRNQGLTQLSFKDYTYNLKSSSLTKIADISNMGTSLTGGTGSDSASVNAGLGANLAARLNLMNGKNKKAALAGVNVDSKIKAASDIMKSMGSKYSGSKGSSKSLASSGANSGVSSANGNKAFGFGDATGDKSSELKDSAINGTPVTSSNQNNGTQSSNNSTSSSLSSNEESVDDGTGMNDDDKEKLLTNVQNNKEQFQPTEEDGIFKLVSKAYVRNLDRILIRKKKIDPENSNLK